MNVKKPLFGLLSLTFLLGSLTFAQTASSSNHISEWGEDAVEQRAERGQLLPQDNGLQTHERCDTCGRRGADCAGGSVVLSASGSSMTATRRCSSARSCVSRVPAETKRRT